MMTEEDSRRQEALAPTSSPHTSGALFQETSENPFTGATLPSQMQPPTELSAFRHNTNGVPSSDGSVDTGRLHAQQPLGHVSHWYRNWSPPASFPPTTQFRGLPHGHGRPYLPSPHNFYQPQPPNQSQNFSHDPFRLPEREHPQQPMPSSLGYFPRTPQQTVTPGDYMNMKPRIAMDSQSPAYNISARTVRDSRQFPSLVLDQSEMQDPTGELMEDSSSANQVSHQPRADSGDAMAMCLRFVANFNAHFTGDIAAIATFQAFLQGFNLGVIDPLRFYIGVYKVLYCGNATNLVQGLLAFLPGTWKVEDLMHVNRQAETDIRRRARVGLREADGGDGGAQRRSFKPAKLPTRVAASVQQTENEQEISKFGILTKFAGHNPEQQEKEKHMHKTSNQALQSTTTPLSPQDMMAPPKERKKRPINAFTTATYSNVEKPKVKQSSQRVFAGPDELSTPSTCSLNTATTGFACSPEASTATTLKRRRESDNEGPQNVPQAEATEAADDDIDDESVPTKITSTASKSKNTAIATPAAKKKKTTPGVLPTNDPSSPQPPTITPRSLSRTSFSTVPASEITHFGPVFPSRRAMLVRDCRPYVHAACGARFMHPDEVRGHHRRTCTGKVTGSVDGWDAHPTCQVSYAMLNATKCKDGYVLLDQESWEKVRSAGGVELEEGEDREEEG